MKEFVDKVNALEENSTDGLQEACNLLSQLQLSEATTDEKAAVLKVVELAIKNNIKIGAFEAGVWAIENGFDTNRSLGYGAVEKGLRRKSIISRSDVSVPEGQQTRGASQTKSGDLYGDTVYIKNLPTHVSANIHNIKGHEAAAVNEYIYGDIYKKLLFNRTPDVQLVVDDADILNQGVYVVRADGEKTPRDIQSIQASSVAKNIVITSRELSDFREIQDVNVNEIKGFEKVLAACLILGENDYHTGNIGLINIGTTEEPNYVAAKIDHGYSGSLKYDTLDDMMNDMVVRFRDNNYDKHQSIKLDAKELKRDIDTMVATLEGLGLEGLKTLLSARVAALRGAGIAVSDSFIKDQVELIMQNVKVAKELSAHLGGVIASQDASKMSGGWFDEFKEKTPETAKRKVPIQVKEIALDHKLKDKVKKAFAELPDKVIDWSPEYFKAIKDAIDKNIKHNGEYVHILALQSGKSELVSMVARKVIFDNVKCKGANAVQYLAEQGVKIGGYTAQEFADRELRNVTNRYPPDIVVMNNLLEAGADASKMNQSNIKKLTKTFEILGLIGQPLGFANMLNGEDINRPINDAANVNKVVSEIGNKDPIEWAIEKGYKIAGKNPIIWALENSNPPIIDFTVELNKRLNQAISDGQIAVVKMILEAAKEKGIAGDLLKFSNKETLGKTSLHYAAEVGEVEIVEVLLEFIKTNNLTKELLVLKDDDEEIPLHKAAERGNVEVVKIFIDAAKYVNTTEPNFLKDQLDCKNCEGVNAWTLAAKSEEIQSIITKEEKAIDDPYDFESFVIQEQQHILKKSPSKELADLLKGLGVEEESKKDGRYNRDGALEGMNKSSFGIERK